MSLQHYEYGLERLQKILNHLSGNRMDAKSDLLRAFKNCSWLVNGEVPESLQLKFLKIDQLVTKCEKDEKNSSWTNSINSLNHDTCEELVSDIKNLYLWLDIYIKRNF